MSDKTPPRRAVKGHRELDVQILHTRLSKFRTAFVQFRPGRVIFDRIATPWSVVEEIWQAMESLMWGV